MKPIIRWRQGPSKNSRGAATQDSDGKPISIDPELNKRKNTFLDFIHRLDFQFVTFENYRYDRA